MIMAKQEEVVKKAEQAPSPKKFDASIDELGKAREAELAVIKQRFTDLAGTIDRVLQIDNNILTLKDKKLEALTKKEKK